MLALAVVVAWKTEPGQRFVCLGKETVVETKKVVWPSRKETIQTTGAVFAFVVTMAVFLWVTDKTLEVGLYDWILGLEKIMSKRWSSFMPILGFEKWCSARPSGARCA